MFDDADRLRLRVRLIAAAQRDPQIDAAALLGSAARGEEDRWSDIDLALRLVPGVELEAVADRWATQLQADEVVVDQLDVRASGGLYRVFLLASTLQVDLSFWPHGHLITGGAPVRLLFGQADDTTEPATGEVAADQLRLAWLCALHVRSALARGRGWQAIWMLHELRNRLVALYCRGHGLNPHEGRGVDGLPEGVLAGLDQTLVTSRDGADLRRVFRLLLDLVLAEARHQELEIPAGLDLVLGELVTSSEPR